MHKITISLDDDIYAGLHQVIGKGKISHFINELVKPYLIEAKLGAAYREMALDKNREKMADEWSENLLNDINGF